MRTDQYLRRTSQTSGVTPCDRLALYLWDEAAFPNEAKFGERWVKAGEDIEKDVGVRIRGSVGVRKDKVDTGEIRLRAVWDVSALAEEVDRFYTHSRMDDYIRPAIGHRKSPTSEVHLLPWEECKLRVDRYLAKQRQPLPVVHLSALQASELEDILRVIKAGKRVIAAELCARFGKTIWAGALVIESQRPLTVIASYVLSSFKSFQKDLSGFEQFKNLIMVDTAHDDYQDRIDEALRDGKQVVAFLSMCNGRLRRHKLDYLFGKRVPRLVVVDEADFGMHQPGQAKALIAATRTVDAIVLMTGTNMDKAVGLWMPDYMTSVVYPELIMEKRTTRESYHTTLKKFTVDPSRHQLYVDVEFYQMGLARVVEWAHANDPGAFRDDGAYLPSWTKFAADPVRAKGFWTRMLQAVFEGKHSWDELNVDYQIKRSSKDGQRVAMMFLPGSTTNVNLTEAAALAQAALPAFRVVPIYGDTMTNGTAEDKVHEEIEKAQAGPVLLLSAGMAQRSFSVGAITELYLAYDSGDCGATVQKISRALTPDQVGKIGRIVSLSFDPNRDDKFDAMLLETAMNYKRTHAVATLKQSLAAVISTIDLFSCSQDGRVRVESDPYLAEALERKSIERVIGKVADLTLLTDDQVQELAAGAINVAGMTKQDPADKGKTRLTPQKKKKGKATPAMAKLAARAREMITTVVENVDVLIYGTGTDSVPKALVKIAKDRELRDSVENKFGMRFATLSYLFSAGVINADVLELTIDNMKKK